MFLSMRKIAKLVDRGLESAKMTVDQKLSPKTMQQESIEFMRMYRRNRIADMKSLNVGSRDFALPNSEKCGQRQAA